MLGNQEVIGQAAPKTTVSDETANEAMRSSASSEVVGIRKACQLQLGQLAAHLPVVTAWMVYQTSDRNRCELRLLCTQVLPDLDAETLAYLESESWLNDALPVLQLSRLPLPYPIYVCLLRPLQPQPEYLLLWTQEALVGSQQQTVEQQAQLLNHWLLTDRELARQRGEVQLLEQVLHKAEHQLRNPLALISLYAENLRLGLTESALQDQASLIRDTVSDLSSNLTDLLHCGQRGKIRTATYDLRALLVETIRAVQPWLEQKSLHIAYPDSPLPLMMDGWQMKQVLSNLLHNAVHFTPSNRTITWHWRTFQQEVLVEVRDQGPGLSDEDLQQVFTPFYSRRPGGTGLGLAIAKKIILDHEGSMWVQNLPGGGAQFSFTLPR